MLTNYASGLCMPEIATMAALERLDMLLNDSMYGILFPRHQHEAHVRRPALLAHAQRVRRHHHQHRRGQLPHDRRRGRASAGGAGVAVHQRRVRAPRRDADAQIGLGDAYEIDPDLEDGFLFALAQAQLARQIFPDAPLKYMPPTKHMTGDIFKGHLIDAMFNLTSVMTHQTIHLCGMLTEAIHTPFSAIARSRSRTRAT
jgi:beta-lysine 5,6-aminomutase alpha subunit